MGKKTSWTFKLLSIRTEDLLQINSPKTLKFQVKRCLGYKMTVSWRKDEFSQE